MDKIFHKMPGLLIILAGMLLAMVIDTLVFPIPGYGDFIVTLTCLAITFFMMGFFPSLLGNKVLDRAADSNQHLHSALDFSNDGIAVLDAQMRAIYMNREFRRLFKIDIAMAKRKPTFSAIVNHACKAGLYDVLPVQLDSFCAQRVAWVQHGNNQPVTFRLTEGTTLRFACQILPDGGRMLNYSNITDLTHDAERLEELANVDGLTGLINRRRFFELADREWSMAIRYGRAISVLMLDIDHFKNINDTFGHGNGDEAIRLVASICTDSKRTSDIVARVGGEEFALLLPETDTAGAMVLAERIRSRVAANPLNIDGKSVAMTISIGVAERAEDVEDFAALLKRSDQQLYVAKKSGRNRVVHKDTPQILPGTSQAA